MFGFIFALIIAAIVLVAVSYVAGKLYNAVQALSEENEQLKLDYRRAADASIEYQTLAEDFRMKFRNKSFQMMDMEKALNLALEDNMPEQVEIKPVQDFQKFRRPLGPMVLGGPRMGKTAMQEKIIEKVSEENPQALIYMSSGPSIKAKDIWLENLKTGERHELSAASVEFSAVDNDKFDPDLWKHHDFNVPVESDTLSFTLGGETLKQLSGKIPAPELMEDWEKELRKKPELYEEFPRPESRKPSVDQKDD